MAFRKPLLHEMLKEDQEPFQLQSYIADRRSELKKPPPPRTAVQLRNRRAEISKTHGNGSLCRHACFFAFQNSPADVRSNFAISPAKSPCKSPNRAVLLHIPSRTAALLLEAAMRIQKQHKPKSVPPSKNVGFGLFGTFVKRLKDRSKNKRRVTGQHDNKILHDKAEESAANSCFHSGRRISSAGWTEDNETKSMEASTSSYGSDWSEDNLAFSETRFCVSPFRFPFHKSPSSNGRRTPEFCSPAASPSRRASKEKENYASPESDKGDEDEEKDQSSPVSVLEPVFEEDDGPESGCNDRDDYDIDCSYANMQRAKEQLLFRLQRFEKLAELNPMELERNLLDESDEESEGEKPSSPYRSPVMDTLVTEVFKRSNLQSFPVDMKKLVCDLIAEEKNEAICSREAVVGRICRRLDSWKDVELDTIDMMVGLDMMKKECGGNGWTKFVEQVEETAAEMEVAVCGLLIDELLEELCYMDRVIGLLVR